MFRFWNADNSGCWGDGFVSALQSPVMGIISTPPRQPNAITPWLADTQARGSLVSCTAQQSQEQYRYPGFISPTISQNAFSFTPRYYKVLQLALPLSFYPPNVAESNLLSVFADTMPTQFVHDLENLAAFVRPDTGAQTVRRIVRPLDCFLGCAEGHHAKYRAEDFFLRDAMRSSHVREKTRRIPITFRREPAQQTCP